MADRASVNNAGAPPQRVKTRTFDVPASRRTIDVALILGLSVAFGLVVTALILGGSVGSFYNLPAVLIVLIGTFAVTLVSYNISELLGAAGAVLATLLPQPHDPRLAGERSLNLAAIARDGGVLTLDAVIPSIDREPFLQRAIAMAVDGAAPHQIDQVLTQEIDAIQDIRHRHAGVLRRAAEVAIDGPDRHSDRSHPVARQPERSRFHWAFHGRCPADNLLWCHPGLYGPGTDCRKT